MSSREAVRRALAVGVVGLAAIAVGPAAASADWSPPMDLSSPGSGSLDSHVAASATGDSYFTWSRRHGRQRYRIQARVQSAAGTWSPIVNISGSKWEPPDSSPTIAAGGDHAVVAWLQGSRVVARSLSPDGTVQWARVVSPKGAEAWGDPEIAVDEQGNAAVTWMRWLPGSRVGIQARWISASGDKRAFQSISRPGNNIVPRVLIAPDDDALITWEESGDGVMLRSLSRDGGTSSIERVSQPAEGRTILGRASVNAGGKVAFWWAREDDNEETWTGYARLRSRSGGWGPIRAITPSVDSLIIGGVAVDDNGDALFAWTQADAGGQNVTFRTRRLLAAGDLSPSQVLAGSEGFQFSTGPALGAGGTAHFAWVGPAHRVTTRSVGRDGTLGPVRTLSGAGEVANWPIISSDGNGGVAATWSITGGTNPRVQAAFGP
jgi:hypothetical protein